MSQSRLGNANQRRSSGHASLAVLSSRTDVETKILLLEMGAGDYVEEPFAVEELIARLRSTIRSCKHTGTKGPYGPDLQTGFC